MVLWVLGRAPAPGAPPACVHGCRGQPTHLAPNSVQGCNHQPPSLSLHPARTHGQMRRDRAARKAQAADLRTPWEKNIAPVAPRTGYRQAPAPKRIEFPPLAHHSLRQTDKTGKENTSIIKNCLFLERRRPGHHSYVTCKGTAHMRTSDPRSCLDGSCPPKGWPNRSTWVKTRIRWSASAGRRTGKGGTCPSLPPNP